MAGETSTFLGPIGQVNQAPRSMLAQAAALYGGMGSMRDVQQSEYLARALDALSQHGGENLKSPLALGSNLLAEALLMWGRGRNDRRLMADAQAGQQAAGRANMIPGEADYDASLAGNPPGATGVAGAGGQSVAPGAAASAGGPMGAGDPGAAPGTSPTNASSLNLGGWVTPDALNAPQSQAPDPAHVAIAAAMAGQGGSLSGDQLAALQANPAAFLGIPGATINSGARTPAHNAAVGGSPTSEHIPGNGYAYDLGMPAGMSTADGMAQLAKSGLPFDQVIDEGRDLHVGFRPQGVAGRGRLMRETGPGQYQTVGYAGGQGGSAPSGQPQSSPFAQTMPPGGDQSTASADQSGAVPRPVQIATGPDPSIPTGASAGPSGASPFQVRPPTGSPPQQQANSSPGPGYPAPQQPAAQGQPARGGIVPQPVPVQPYQFQRLHQLEQAARAQPQLFGPQALAYRQELQDQATKAEGLEIGRPNDAGQVPILGKVSGRFYGWQSAPGAIVSAGPRMTLAPGANGQPAATPVQGTTWQADPNSPVNATRMVNPSTGEVKYVENPSFGPVGQGQQLTAAGARQIPGTQGVALVNAADRAAAGIQPYDRAGYVRMPNGDIKKTVEDAFGPTAQLDYTSKIQALDPYKNYMMARQNLDAMRQLMSQPGGFADLSFIENAGKTINPTIAIRPNMIEQYGKEVGWPDWLIGEASSVLNHGGHLTAEGRNALFNIAQANTQSHWNALQPILGKVDYDARKFGLTRQDLLPDLQPMMPVGSPSYPGASIPGQAPGSQNAASVIAAARAAIARGAPRDAVIQRTRALGVDPTGL